MGLGSPLNEIETLYVNLYCTYFGDLNHRSAKNILICRNWPSCHSSRHFEERLATLRSPGTAGRENSQKLAAPAIAPVISTSAWPRSRAPGTAGREEKSHTATRSPLFAANFPGPHTPAARTDPLPLHRVAPGDLSSPSGRRDDMGAPTHNSERFSTHHSSFIFHPSSFIFHPSSFIFHLSSFIFHLVLRSFPR
jgi:hypothetical protein